MKVSWEKGDGGGQGCEKRCQDAEVWVSSECEGCEIGEEGDAESERIEGSRGCEYEGRETFKNPLVYCEGNLSHLFANINKGFCFIGYS